MSKITIDLDDGLIARLAVASRARNMTVEEWLRAQAEQSIAIAVGQIENDSHRAILASLNRPEGYYDSPRDETYDRERHRAEDYADRRRELLELIDNTQGDMGAQTWNRSALYAP